MAKIEKTKVWMALAMIPPVVVLIIVGAPIALRLMVLLAIFFGLREYYNLVLPSANGVERSVGIGLGLVLSFMISFGHMDKMAPFLIITLVILSILSMVTSKELSSSILKIGITLFGILFIGFLLSYVSLVGNMQNGTVWVLFLIVTIWAGDISALLIGSFFGRHKLYPKISPKKTFEGLGGAIAGSIIVALAFCLLYPSRLPKGSCILLSVGLGILGQLGDFTESMLKRSAQVKDSGTLIPGHGGMLDRIDSFLFASPFFYYSLLYLLKETS